MHLKWACTIPSWTSRNPFHYSINEGFYTYPGKPSNKKGNDEKDGNQQDGNKKDSNKQDSNEQNSLRRDEALLRLARCCLFACADAIAAPANNRPWGLEYRVSPGALLIGFLLNGAFVRSFYTRQTMGLFKHN